MAFKQVLKGTWFGSQLPENTVSVGKAAITISKDLQKYFNDKDYVQVFIDRENNRIGFLPSNDKMTGFKIVKKDTTLSFTCTQVIKSIQSKRYRTYMEDGYICFDVTEIADTDK